VRGEQLWAPGGCCGRSGALGTMALCARAALLLGVLQVLALLGAAQDPTDAQGKLAGAEEAHCGGLPLHVRRPRGKFHASTVDSHPNLISLFARGPPAERDSVSPLLGDGKPAWCAELAEFPWDGPSAEDSSWSSSL
jgi:hypothetical protein